MKESENPQAFTLLTSEYDEQGRILSYYEPGMTLRDHFAGQFLAGVANTLGDAETLYCGRIAKDCYKIADAMLKERIKKQ